MQFAPTITSRSNARVKALRAAFEGSASSPGALVGIEGEHLLAEAIRSGLPLQTVFVREGGERVLERAALAELGAREIVTLSREVFESVVETQSPQGIAATLTIPEPLPANGGVTLIVEDLQDPGNLGTLIRSLEAFGGGHVLATRATVNAWSPKVIRSSAGSIFRVPVERMILPEIRKRVSERRVYAAVAQSERAASVFETDFSERMALMIGNEGAGLSSEALAIADQRVWIPCSVESLNAAVAGSTLLFEVSRQRLTRQGMQR